MVATHKPRPTLFLDMTYLAGPQPLYMFFLLVSLQVRDNGWGRGGDVTATLNPTPLDFAPSLEAQHLTGAMARLQVERERGGAVCRTQCCTQNFPQTPLGSEIVIFSCCVVSVTNRPLPCPFT